MPVRPGRQCRGPRCTAMVYSSKYCAECRKKNTKVYLVIGPSGSGKTTYVSDHARRGDLILDFDLLFKAISGQDLYDKPATLLPFLLAARKTMMDMIGEVDFIPTAWIVRNKITKDEIRQLESRLGAEVIELRVNAIECKKRLESDPLRPPAQMQEWFRRVDEWWSDHG